MFWLAGGSAASANRDAIFSQLDPLSEDELEESRQAASATPVTFAEEVDAPPLIMPTGVAYNFRDAGPRGGDPTNGPVLIPLPPAAAAGLITLGGAIALAVRHRLRRR